ncbi:two-component system nitrogen regulation response regulator GlnG [Hasllibacter halocynthiae]|uniref:DNA-binding transcriptional regulator NtrC n=1 Tax=Hasllibacter halocynthiae TaxID=595589 RepID=A0A2T0X892_9RHOB|nr:response regulator [Hasllibacter halocynthiae]PRY95170.1 two-component system nitrogen regulation response regulator GlnG [Hasllibacter halocynthiae]
MDGTVLVADDDRTIRTVLTQALTRAGCRVHATSSLTTLMRWVGEGKGDLVITDVMMPDGNGLEMIPAISGQRPGLPVIVISAQNTIMTAIQAAEAEAYDYLPKPFDLPDLMKRSAKALARDGAPRAATAAPPPPGAEDELPLVGRAPVMQAIYRLVARVVNSELPILVTGESGTGKSLAARAIHDLSDRRTQPYVPVSGADLEGADGPAALLARARGGTLALEEVGDFPPGAQAKLVRLLDALPDPAPRAIATTQTDLNALMEAGGFRQDLFYRLGGVVIDLPPLRDRVEDIPLLAEHFLLRAEREGMPQRALSDGAREAIRAFTWPGNVRQLENTVRRLAATGTEPLIADTEVAAVLGSQPRPEPAQTHAEEERLSASVARHLRRYFDLHAGELPPAGLHRRIIDEVERPLIEICLYATGGNQARAADLMGINRNTLRKKIVDLKISVTRRRKLS